MDTNPIVMETYKGYTIERVETLPNQYRYTFSGEDDFGPTVDTIEDARGCIDYLVECPKHLYITELINKTQDLVCDGKMNMAERGGVVIQDIELERGNRYRISVIMELIKVP
jgi:hypothetical protein